MRLTTVAGAIAAVLLAGSAGAATLTHAYDFNGTAVTDRIGSANGVLVGNATVSGGQLRLDGDGDYAELSQRIVPLSGAFSVYIKFDSSVPQASGLVEMISQGSSRAPGFYIGVADGKIRLTDYYGALDTAFPTGAHDLLFTTGGGTQLLLDGTVIFSSASDLTFGDGGSNTRFGNQFAPFGEYFNGSLDEVRVFDGIATYAEATAGIGSVPEPATWAMLVGGFGAAGGVLRRRARPGRTARA